MINLETTAEERKSFAAMNYAAPGSFLHSFIIDFDCLLADNEAKERDYVRHHHELCDEIDKLNAELSRLKSRPTSEEVESAARTLEWQADNIRAFGLWAHDKTEVETDWRNWASLLRRLAAQGNGWRPTHRHYKGGLYRVVALGRIEADLSPVVIYDNENGETWVRPADEFNGYAFRAEGTPVLRFTTLPSPPSPPSTEDKT